MNVQLALRSCYQKKINYDHPEYDGETTERIERYARPNLLDLIKPGELHIGSI